MRTLSPDGDIYLTFHPDSPSSPSAPSNGSQPSETTSQSITDSANNNDTPNDHTSDPTCLRVSSAVLSRKSPVFDRMLNGPYREAVALAAQHSVTINLAEDDPDAVFHLLNLLHEEPFPPPAELDLETLAHVASLVEKYMLHQVSCNRHVQQWMETFTDGSRYADMHIQPDTHMTDILLWLAATRVLQYNGQVESWQRIAIREAGTREDLPGFPLARSVQDDIQCKRVAAITRVQSFLQTELDACRPQPRRGENVIPGAPYGRSLWDSLVFGNLYTIGTQWGLLPRAKMRAREFPGVRLRDLARNAAGMVDLNELMVADKDITAQWTFDPRSVRSTLAGFAMSFAGFVLRPSFLPTNSVYHPDDFKARLVHLLRKINDELDLGIQEWDVCSRCGRAKQSTNCNVAYCT